MRRIRSRPLLVALAAVVTLLVLGVVVPRLASHHTAAPSATSLPSEEPPGDEGGSQEGEEEGEDPDADSETGPEDGVLSERATKGGIPRAALDRAAAQASAVAARTRAVAPELAAASWSFVGPRNIGGRVLDIAVDPATAGTLYAATATGGVWKSTDAGATMVRSWPDGLSQSIGAIAAAPDGTLYAGGGEAGPGGGSITYGGRGVYRSTDGGAHWKRAGNMPSPTVGRILVDPADPDRVFVAGSGDLFNPGGGRGVYRSTDAGAHWTRVLKGTTKTTGAVDLAMDPSNPDVLYAAMWDHIRKPDERIYGGKGSGVYRSTDGGDSWTRLGNGLPPAGPDVGRIGIALSASTPKRVYAVMGTTDGGFQGLYRSNDAGDSWTKLTASGLAGSQSSYSWWFGRLWVDPSDKDRLFAAGVPLELSTDGGQTFGSAGSVHADQHAMAWDPNVAQRVYLGNDGGVYRSNTGGSGGWTVATVQPFTQFYSVDVSEQDTTRVVGGAQDNNALRSWPTNWNAFVGGDGEETLIDPTNQNAIYGCSQYGACSRSTTGGTSTLPFGATTSDRYNWFTPVVLDPSNPQVVYLGGNRLNRSANGAATFGVISPDLTGGPGHDSYPFGTITTVAASATKPNELLVGTDDGRLWYTTNLGGTWIQASDPDLPGFWISRVAIDPTDAKVMYVTYSGYRSGTETPYVLKSANTGAAWTDITGNLPAAPVNDLVVDGAALYAATDVGVYVTSDGGGTWNALGTGLPNLPVDDIELVASTDELYAATFGRGMWKVSLAGL
jgi:hypothetical protein